MRAWAAVAALLLIVPLSSIELGLPGNECFRARIPCQAISLNVICSKNIGKSNLAIEKYARGSIFNAPKGIPVDWLADGGLNRPHSATPCLQHRFNPSPRMSAGYWVVRHDGPMIHGDRDGPQNGWASSKIVNEYGSPGPNGLYNTSWVIITPKIAETHVDAFGRSCWDHRKQERGLQIGKSSLCGIGGLFGCVGGCFSVRKAVAY